MVEKQIGDTKFNTNISEFDIKFNKILFIFGLSELCSRGSALRKWGKRKRKG